MRPDVFARYAGMHVPRYTSYPTAPHFSPAVGHAEHSRWLGQIPAEESISIYIHIPFCREMCWYCGCHTTVASRQAPISRYVSALTNEIRLVTAQLPSRLKVGHLHWGGGSPTLLTPAAIEELWGELSRSFDFGGRKEIALEVDPRTLSEPVVEAFARAGVNRASLGVQSFDPKVQAAINRVQSFEVTVEAVDLLRRFRVDAINVDLVYGLPFQTTASCIDTVKEALRLRPQRLAIFGYAHVPAFKPHQRKIDEAALPDPAERQDQFRAMADTLVSKGYVQIGLDHFALPTDELAIAVKAGGLHRNFQGYTTDSCTTLLGFGASAIGRLPSGYVQNATKIAEFERSVAEGRPAVARGYRLDADDRRRSAIIQQLMCDYKADVGSVDAPLDRLEADGLIRRCGTIVEVVEEARPLIRVVAAAFDAYLPNSTARHVVAV